MSTCPAGMAVGTVSETLTRDGSQYMVFLPSGWSPEKKHPVCLFLHGAGGVSKVDNIRGQSLTRMLLTPEYAAKMEHIVLIPVATTREWKNHFPFVMSLVDMAIADLSGDPSRVALAGQSMGGHGTWMLAAQHADRFCAVVPICGYVQRDDAAVSPDLVKALVAKPLWVLCATPHTRHDSPVCACCLFQSLALTRVHVRAVLCIQPLRGRHGRQHLELRCGRQRSQGGGRHGRQPHVHALSARDHPSGRATRRPREL